MLACLTAAAFMNHTYEPQSLPHVDANHLRATVEKLSSFPTRNTNSPEHIRACEWLAEEFRKIPGCQVELMRYPVMKSRRTLQDGEAVQVVATLPGEEEDIVLMGAHMDSLNLEVDPVTGRAPGANDDASGVAATLEVCRILSGAKHRNTLKFVAFSGEEQGLLGSTALAKRAKAENWAIRAVLSNDTVGSSSNKAGQKDDSRVRVFSEEGEAHHSRELARWMEWQVRQNMSDFGIKLVFRRDRFGRGGDHTPFVAEGFSAVRFVEVHEEYSHQHTPDDLIEYMDFEYLAKVATANALVMGVLGDARPSPERLQVQRAENHTTRLTWKADPDTRYVVYWRETTSPVWQHSAEAGSAGSFFVDAGIDDCIFGVGSIGNIPRIQPD